MNIQPLCILIADDDDDARQTLATCLEILGHNVTCVVNGQEAIEIIDERQFDIIITDLLMPKADGLEVIMAARRAQPEAGIIAMSGGGKYFDAPDLLKSARLLGAEMQLSKPFSREQLVGAIEHFERRGAEIHAA